MCNLWWRMGIYRSGKIMTRDDWERLAMSLFLIGFGIGLLIGWLLA